MSMTIFKQNPIKLFESVDDADNIKSSYDNGVLKIKVPKKTAEPKKGKNITVK